MQKVILTVGIPGSGKTTWSLQHMLISPRPYIRVNNDDLRETLFQGVFSKDNEKLLTTIRRRMVVDALVAGKNVIIDNLNLNPYHFEATVKDCTLLNKDIEIMEVLFPIDVHEAIRRDAERERSVGEDIIYSWYSKFLDRPQEEKCVILSENRELWYRGVSDYPNAIICDMDGTFALHHPQRNPYDGLFADHDFPNRAVLDILKRFKNDHTIIFVSGRSKGSEYATRTFIETHFGGEYILHLREDGDNRHDHIFKQEVFDNHIKDLYHVKFVMDDRLSVCKMWHENGLPLFRFGDPEAVF